MFIASWRHSVHGNILTETAMSCTLEVLCEIVVGFVMKDCGRGEDADWYDYVHMSVAHLWYEHNPSAVIECVCSSTEGEIAEECRAHTSPLEYLVNYIQAMSQLWVLQSCGVEVDPPEKSYVLSTVEDLLFNKSNHLHAELYSELCNFSDGTVLGYSQNNN